MPTPGFTAILRTCLRLPLAMWLIASLYQSVRWFVSVGAKLFRVTPILLTVTVCATVVSQAAQILAVLAPLKVIILIGSGHIPGYFPTVMQGLHLETLVLALSAGAGFLYVLHLSLDKWTGRLVEVGAASLSGRNLKLVVIPNQDTVVARAYRRASRAVAEVLFSFGAWVLLLVLYPVFAGFVVLELVVALGVALLIFHWRPRVETSIDLPGITQSLAAAGFFVSFGYLIVDYMVGASPNVLVAILCLLIVRQLMTKLASAASQLAGLNADRNKVDRLLFHALPAEPPRQQGRSGMWALLRDDGAAELAQEVLGPDTNLSDASVSWVQTGVPRVLSVIVSGPGVSEASARSRFVKVFDLGCEHLATHEAMLIQAFGQRLPVALQLERRGSIREHAYLVFSADDVWELPPGEVRSAIVRLRSTLMALVVPWELEDRSRRTSHMLHQRLGSHLTERLMLIASPKERDVVDAFADSLPGLRSALEALPVAVTNPDISNRSIRGSTAGPVGLHWGRWSIEPVGADWPIGLQSRLRREILRASETRPDLAGANPDHVAVAMLVGEFEKLFLRQHYSSAIELIPEILDRLHSDTAVSAIR